MHKVETFRIRREKAGFGGAAWEQKMEEEEER